MMPSLFKKSDFKIKYQMGKSLGKGNFAEVKQATNKETNEQVAVKIINVQDEEDYEYIKKEIEILGRLKHDNIVGLIEIFETTSMAFGKRKKKVLIVMELVTGGELFDRIIEKKVFSENDAKGYVRTILDALDYMHANGVVHRDLKPENILMLDESEDSPIKIADFGLSKLYDPGQDKQEYLFTMCGTPGYVAPEILKKRGYGPQVDVWATGVLLYILLCGFPPFFDESRDKLFRKICKGKFKFPSPAWDKISPEAKELVAGLLKTNPDERLTPSQALEHKWFQTESTTETTLASTIGLKQYQTRRTGEKQWRQLKTTLQAASRLQHLNDNANNNNHEHAE